MKWGWSVGEVLSSKNDAIVGNCGVSVLAANAISSDRIQV